MYSCILWIKSLLLRIFALVRYVAPRNNDQVYQLQQFPSPPDNTNRDDENTLNVELRKNSMPALLKPGYQDESFIQPAKHEFNDFENSAGFQDIEQHQPDIEEGDVRQFIDETPVAQLSNTGLLREIGDRSVQVFMEVIDRMDGYEQLESGADDFHFWIRYIETPEKFQISVMRYKFTLNTTLDNYLNFMQDLDLQKQLDNSIDAFESHYKTDEVQVNYLRYKKILFMDPRDFLYVKRVNRQSENLCVEISKSVHVEDFHPKVPSAKSTTRAILQLSGNIIRQVEDNKLEVDTYSECNMKLKLKPVMTKTASKNEIKKMVKKYRDHFNQN